MGKEQVAVLGAGNGGLTVAADLTLAGYSVRLYQLPEFEREFRPIMEKPEIEITGEARNGVAQISIATTDIKVALDGVKYVIVVVPAFGHRRMAEVCAPYVEDGQIIALVPGGFGTLEFYNVFRRMGVKKKVFLAETSTLPYGTRIAGSHSVIVHTKAINVPAGVFPSKYTKEIIPELQKLYPEISESENVLDAALNNTNPCVHPAPTILSASRIEYADDFYLYKEAMTPSVRRVMVAVDRERIRIREALGLNPPHFPLNPNNYEVFEGQFGAPGIAAGYKMRGPLDLRSRYITEDVPYGLTFYRSIAAKVGVKTPVCDALITIASTLNGEDYFTVGRTLESLGLADLTLKQLNDLLSEGAI